jgi:hypothetical protein
MAIDLDHIGIIRRIAYQTEAWTNSVMCWYFLCSIDAFFAQFTLSTRIGLGLHKKNLLFDYHFIAMSTLDPFYVKYSTRRVVAMLYVLVLRRIQQN